MATISTTIAVQDRVTSVLNSMARGADKVASGFSKIKQSASGNLGSGFKALGSTINDLDGKMQKSSGLMKSMLGANLISSGITTSIGAIKNGIVGLGSDLSEASATWQTFQGNMSNLKMPQAQINGTKKQLQDFAQATIYSASDMASTYSQLAAVGTKNTTQLVKGFGGLAAASAEPSQAMKTLSQQATQMAAKPKVQWEDFKLMLEQSPAGMAAVAKTMGVSTGQMIKNIQAGKVATSDFFNAVSKTGTNANFTKMATQFKTVGQAVDGLKETVTNKLQGAFDRASKVGISFVSGLADKIQAVNFDALADKAMAAFTKIQQAVSTFASGFSSTFAMTDVQDAFVGVKLAIGDVINALAGVDKGASPMEGLKKLGTEVGHGISIAANAVQKLANFISSLDPSTIRTIFSVVKSGLVAFVAFRIAVAGIAKAFKAWEAAMQAVQTAKSIAGAFGLIEKTAKPAADGAGAMGKAAGKSAGDMLKLGAAALMVGAGLALAAVGMGVLAFSAIKLAAAGPGAVATMLLMVAALAGLIAIVSVVGEGLTAGAVGMLAFGASMVLVAAAVVIAAFGISLLTKSLPMLSTYGTSAAVGLLALGGAMLVFGPAAIAAAAGLVLLGAGLLVVGAAVIVAAVGVLALGAGMLLLGAGTLVVAAGMTILAAVFPVIASSIMGVAGGFALTAASLMLLAPTALLAAVAVAALGAGLLIMGAGALVAGVGLLVLSAPLMLIAAFGQAAALGFVAMAGALILFTPAALLAGAASVVLGAGLVVLSAAVIIVSVGLAAMALAMTLLGAATMVVTLGMTMLAVTLPIIAATVMTVAAGFGLMTASLLVLAPMAALAAAAVTALGIGLVALGAGALIAGAGAVVLGGGLVVVAAGLGLVAVAAAATGAGLIALGAGVRSVAAAFVAAGSMIVSAISGAMRNVISAVRTGISNAVSAAKSFGSALVSVGADLIKGLISGIKSMVGNAISAVEGAVKDVVAKAKSLLHIGSPSKLFKKFGRWTLEGYTIGVNDRAEQSANAMGNAMAGVVDAGSGMTIAGPSVISSDPVAAVSADMRDMATVAKQGLTMDGPTVTSLNPASTVANDMDAMKQASQGNLGTIEGPSVTGMGIGDRLATGFDHAATAVGNIRDALASLPTKAAVAIQGNFGGWGATPSLATDTPMMTAPAMNVQMPSPTVDVITVPSKPMDTPTTGFVQSSPEVTSAPVNLSAGGNTTSTTNHSETHTVNVEAGAIQIIADKDTPIEEIVQAFEDYLKKRAAQQL